MRSNKYPGLIRSAKVAVAGMAVVLLGDCAGPERKVTDRNVRVGPSRKAVEKVDVVPAPAGVAPALDRPFDLDAPAAAGSTQREDGHGILSIGGELEHDGHHLALQLTSEAVFSGTTQVLEVVGGRATKLRTTYDKLEVTMQVRATMDGQEQVNRMPSQTLPLQGETVLSELRGDFYHRRLESGAPTAEQAEMLKEPRPVITQYAGRPVSVGATWDVSTDALEAMAGGLLDKVTGPATGRLVTVSPCGEHTCAQVSFAGDVRGELPIGLIPDGLHWRMEGKCQRDVTRNLDLACHSSGPLSGRLQLGPGAEIEATGSLQFDWRERAVETP